MCKNPRNATASDAKPKDPPKRRPDPYHPNKSARDLETGVLYCSLSAAFLIGGFSTVMPFYQSRRDSLGCDALCYGSMTSLRSFLSLLGASIVGRLSDDPRVGRKSCLYVGCFAALTGLVVSLVDPSLRGMWWSAIPGALFQQNFGVMKALLTDYHGAEEDDGDSDAARAGSAGKLGMAVGLSFMVGPLLGTMVVTDFNGGIKVACGCLLISALLVTRLPVPVVTKVVRPEADLKKGGLLSFLDVAAARSPAAIFLMSMRVFMTLAYHIFSTVWTISLKERFSFGPKDHGQFMSFVGLSYAFSQGYLAKQILKLFGPDNRTRVILSCCVALGIGRWCAFWTNSLQFVYVFFFGIITALGVMNTIITADTGRLAPSAEIGGLFGVLQSVESAAGIVGPILGGILGKVGDGVTLPLLAVIGMYGVVFLMVLFGYDKFVIAKFKSQKTTDKIKPESVPIESRKDM